MKLVEDEGCNAARFPGHSLAPHDEEATKCMIQECPGFCLMYDHILEYGLTPQVVIEPDNSTLMGFLVIALATKEQFNWVALFMHDPMLV